MREAGLRAAQSERGRHGGFPLCRASRANSPRGRCSRSPLSTRRGACLGIVVAGSAAAPSPAIERRNSSLDDPRRAPPSSSVRRARERLQRHERASVAEPRERGARRPAGARRGPPLARRAVWNPLRVALGPDAREHRTRLVEHGECVEVQRGVRHAEATIAACRGRPCELPAATGIARGEPREPLHLIGVAVVSMRRGSM